MMWWYCKGLSGALRGQGLQREPGEGSFEEVPLERRGRALVVVITNRATNQPIDQPRKQAQVRAHCDGDGGL